MEYKTAVERIGRYSGLADQFFCRTDNFAVRYKICFVAVVPSYADHENFYGRNWELQDENYLGFLRLIDCKLMFVIQRQHHEEMRDIELIEEDFFIFNYIPWHHSQ